MASKNLWGSALNYNGSTKTDELGSVRSEYDSTDKVFKTYRFVMNTGSTATTVGDCVAFSNAGTGIITGDSDCYKGAPAGVAPFAIDTNSYGWIQVGGMNSSVKLVGGVTDFEGEYVVLSANAAGATIALGTASTYKPIGVIAVGLGSIAVHIACGDVFGI